MFKNLKPIFVFTYMFILLANPIRADDIALKFSNVRLMPLRDSKNAGTLYADLEFCNKSSNTYAILASGIQLVIKFAPHGETSGINIVPKSSFYKDCLYDLAKNKKSLQFKLIKPLRQESHENYIFSKFDDTIHYIILNPKQRFFVKDQNLGLIFLTYDTGCVKLAYMIANILKNKKIDNIPIYSKNILSKKMNFRVNKNVILRSSDYTPKNNKTFKASMISVFEIRDAFKTFPND